MERRRFLLALAAGLAGAALGRGTTGLVDPEPATGAAAPGPAGTPVPAAREVDLPTLTPVPPPTGVVSELPGPGPSLAITIDDGTNSEVVGSLTQFAADSGVRLTFFPNGVYSSWTDHAAALAPLIESGQVAMGNHTWSHPDITTLTDEQVAEEIRRNQDFLRNTFGVHDSPFFRPPFGAHDARTDRIAADVGHPTIAMWNGDLGDSRVVTAADLVAAADTAFTAQSIVLGHANQRAVTEAYEGFLALIADRGLQTVTLADVWATLDQRMRGAEATGRGSTA